MFKIIRTARFNELNQQLDGLRSTNGEKAERINVLEGYTKSLEDERESLRETNQRLRANDNGLTRDLRIASQKIEELQAQAKIQNKHSLSDKETIFELRGKIEKLEAEVARHKNEASEQRELRKAVMKPEKFVVETVSVPAEEIPNTTKAVELPSVEIVPEVREQCTTAKRTYTKRNPKNRKRK